MSIFKTYEITVDTMKENQNVDIRFSQGDLNTAKLIITILHDGSVLNLVGYAVRLALVKTDGKRVYQDCTIIDGENGVVEVVLSSQTLAIAGVVEGELSISLGENKQIISTKFQFTVEKSIMNNNIVKSMNEIPVLEKAISIANSLTDVDFENLIEVGEGLETFKNQVTNRFNFVTPEMFGAVGNGVADDSQAIINADNYANRNNLKLLGFKTYKISNPIQLFSSFVDFSEGEIILSDNFPSDKAITLTGVSYVHSGSIKLNIDGNRNNQSLDIRALFIHDYGRLGFVIDVVANNCFNAVTVFGSTEKGCINVSARNTDRILVEEGQAIQSYDTTPDEMRYFINDGYNCKQFYFKDSISASVVTFNTENSNDKSGIYEYLVDIQCDFKNTQLLGIIRTPAIKVIGISRDSIVNFGGLIVYSPSDLALDVISARTISGSIDIESAQNCGVWVRGVTYASYLNIKVSNFRGQYPVKIGEYNDVSNFRQMRNSENEFKRVNNSQFNIFVSAMIEDSNVLEIDYARRCVINLFYTGNKPATGGIVIRDPEHYFTLNADCGIIQNNIPVTKANANACDINFVGGTVSKETVLGYSTPLNGMKAALRTTGHTATYDGTAWQVPNVAALT